MNATVGALEANRRKIAQFMGQARRAGADLVLFPELVVSGYPPEDLLLKPAFIRDELRTLRALAASSRGLVAVVGCAIRDTQEGLGNAAVVFSHGRRVAAYRKMVLPNYGVFDEKRYFTPGNCPLILELPDSHFRVGLSVCEDIWVDAGPCAAEGKAGSHLLVNISASPYRAGKGLLRERMLSRRARQCRSWIAYVNLVGGQDELVFDGGSMLVAPSGKVVFRAPQFEEGLFITDLPRPPVSPRRIVRRPFPRLGRDEEIFRALILGLKDYVRKNGFSKAVLGLSGGIDSNLTAAIAVAALGRKSVIGVSMPSLYSSSGTRRDARQASKALGIRFLEMPIGRMLKASLASLKEVMGKSPRDTTEENLQARIRGMLLMALSNKFGWLVLATGNKSEISTGYCTLYGDMVGGFAVIKDVPKVWVYRLARAANRHFRRKVIPDSVMRRPPTAELRPNQRDQDTLPPYPKLDAILRAYIEEQRPVSEIRKRLRSARPFISQAIRRVDVNEYKRRQAPPGIKITPLAFGRDRRMPITNAYRER